jgi:cobalt-zinc-cadmium resistance protein CzcA
MALVLTIYCGHWSENNANQGAGYIERNGQQILVRSQARLSSVEDIGNVVVTLTNQSPVTVNDIAEVAIGKELRTGAATLEGQETVLGTAMMLIGENSRAVALDVADKVDEIQASLPEGVLIQSVYDRTALVDKAINTVRKNLIEGRIAGYCRPIFTIGQHTSCHHHRCCHPSCYACHDNRYGKNGRKRET